jgi:hypothetical protein
MLCRTRIGDTASIKSTSDECEPYRGQVRRHFEGCHSRPDLRCLYLAAGCSPRSGWPQPQRARRHTACESNLGEQGDDFTGRVTAAGRRRLVAHLESRARLRRGGDTRRLASVHHRATRVTHRSHGESRDDHRIRDRFALVPEACHRPLQSVPRWYLVMKVKDPAVCSVSRPTRSCVLAIFRPLLRPGRRAPGPAHDAAGLPGRLLRRLLRRRRGASDPELPQRHGGHVQLRRVRCARLARVHEDDQLLSRLRLVHGPGGFLDPRPVAVTGLVAFESVVHVRPGGASDGRRRHAGGQGASAVALHPAFVRLRRGLQPDPAHDLGSGRFHGRMQFDRARARCARGPTTRPTG